MNVSRSPCPGESHRWDPSRRAPERRSARGGAAVFFFLRIRRPPRSPLFPSRTLFRSLSGGLGCAAAAVSWVSLRGPEALHSPPPPRTRRGRVRALLLRGYESVMNRDFAYLLFGLA